MLNTELLLKVKEQILKEPLQFIMGNWFQTKHEIVQEPIPNCGTAACIAGWAIAIHNQMNPAKACAAVSNHEFKWHSSEFIADDILDPKGDITVSNLFYVDRWPYQLAFDFRNSEDPVRRAQLAAQAIDMFIADPESFGEETEYED